MLGRELEECGLDPLTGFYGDGCCSSGPQDVGNHTVCAVVTAEFLAHQQQVGNDLSTPRPEYRFPGLVPGDRWCVVALRWLQAYEDGVAAPVVLAATNERSLRVIPLDVLREHAVDVPSDPSALGGSPASRRNVSRRQWSRVRTAAGSQLRGSAVTCGAHLRWCTRPTNAEPRTPWPER